MSGSQVKLTAWPRVHLGLVDLGGATQCRYGGSGCSVEGRPVEVFAEPARDVSVELATSLEARTQDDLVALQARIAAALGDRGARIVVEQAPPEHVGLGSKTALLLAVACAAMHVGRGATGRTDLQRLSGRGGTSGAGINLFFDGGFVVDGGQPYANDAEWTPSSDGPPAVIPPVLARHEIPKSWRFHLIQVNGHGPSGVAEREFFRTMTPIPRVEVLESLAALHHGVLPGFAAGNLGLVARGLRTAHGVGFKRRELERQTARVQNLYGNIASDPTIAVGLSSVGPLIFAITDADDAGDRVVQLAHRTGAKMLKCVRPINHGYLLRES